jgi:hypothetical protein
MDDPFSIRNPATGMAYPASVLSPCSRNADVSLLVGGDRGLGVDSGKGRPLPDVGPWRRLRRWLEWWILIGWVSSAWAQFPPESMLSAATTAPATEGRAWVYVGWSAVNPAVLQGRMFGIHLKPGGPGGPGAFERVARVAAGSTDLASAEDWVARAAELGDAPGELAAALDALAPVGVVTDAVGAGGKLSAALSAAKSDPAVAAALELIASRYHAVRFALGRAWAGRQPVGPLMIEVREMDPVTGLDRWVVSRLTVEVGRPTPLPAPGGPWVARQRVGVDNLRVGLVWSEPDTLRRRSPLVAGFDVWRVPAAEARANAWDTQPPTGAELTVAGFRINEVPVASGRHWSDVEAFGAAGDPANALFTDVGAGPFRWRDGDEFAWFIVARDWLGNPGTSSLAGFGQVCALKPPEIPRNLAAGNDFSPGDDGTVRQRIRLHWLPSLDTEGPVTRFEVYRGQGELPPVASTNEPPVAWRVGSVDAQGGPGLWEWRDDSLDPAADPGLFGAGFWYAVRSVRETPCGPVVSALSPPVVVNLRRFEAPDAPSGSLGLNCPRVVIQRMPNVPAQEPLESPAPGDRNYRVQVRRRDRGVAWVDVTVTSGMGGTEPVESPRLRFGSDDEAVEFSFTLPRIAGGAPAVVGTVVAGAFTGARSEPMGFEMPGDFGVEVRWVTTLMAATVSLSEVGSGESWAAGLGIGPFPLPDAERDEVGTVLARSPDASAEILIEAVAAEAPAETPWRLVTITRPALSVTGEPKLVFRDPRVPEEGLPNRMRYRAWILPPVRNGSDGGCAHVARPAGSGRVEPISVRMTLAPRSRQWRIFRSVDDGPLTLIAEGVVAPGAAGLSAMVDALDDGMPAGAARLCYFGQATDEHGNESPLGPLGCEDVAPAELPVPLLAEPLFEGDVNHPVARLRWFCPPHGLNHFRVVLKPVTGAAPAQGVSAITASVVALATPMKRAVSWSSQGLTTSGKVAAVVMSEFVTGPVGAETPGRGPEFSQPMDVEAGMTYEVMVAAVDARGQAGHASYARRFRWRPPGGDAEREVPWPQRPLPPVTPGPSGMVAVLLSTNPVIWPGAAHLTPVGVRIGSLTLGQRELVQDLLGLGLGDHGGRLMRLFVARAAIEAGRGFEAFLFSDAISRSTPSGFRLLNVVLYREQVTNQTYLEVSGDVVQVSPLFRKVACRVLPAGDGFEFLDPMVGLTLHVPPPGAVEQGSARIDVHLLDLHPVVRGARYRYWVVHFDDQGEPDRTLPAGEVEVPR